MPTKVSIRRLALAFAAAFALVTGFSAPAFADTAPAVATTPDPSVQDNANNTGWS